MKKHFLLLLLAVSFNHISAMDDEDWDLNKEIMDADEIPAPKSPKPLVLNIADIVIEMMPAPEFDDKARLAVFDECKSLVAVRPVQFHALQQQGLDMPGIVKRFASSMVEDMRHAIILQKNSPQWRHLVSAK